MYYKSVNRGMTLTPPGLYTVALVLVLGLLAIGSGYNAIYLSLSLGMAILIISGLLSEKVMRHYLVLEMKEVTAEPNTPFVVHLEVQNQSDSLFLYGVENVLVRENTKLSPVALIKKALMKSTVMVLPPRRSETVAGQCQGFARGVYRDFEIIQRTVYPFGLVNKFKVSKLSTRVAILPVFNEDFARLLRDDFKKRILGRDDEREFHNHRSYTLRDSMRFVDWKKSAGRPVLEWLVKEYDSRIEEFGVLLEPDWDAILGAATEADYENQLSLLRTACDAIEELGRKTVLLCSDQRLIVGQAEIRRVLIDAPIFSKRATLSFPDPLSIASGNFVVLQLDAQGNHHWGQSSIYLRNA